MQLNILTSMSWSSK